MPVDIFKAQLQGSGIMAIHSFKIFINEQTHDKNQQKDKPAPSKDSDQPRHLPSPTSLNVPFICSKGPKASSCRQQTDQTRGMP